MTLTAAALGTPAPNFHWYKDDEEIFIRSNLKIQTTSNGSQLIIEGKFIFWKMMILQNQCTATTGCLPYGVIVIFQILVEYVLLFCIYILFSTYFPTTTIHVILNMRPLYFVFLLFLVKNSMRSKFTFTDTFLISKAAIVYITVLCMTYGL